MLKHFFYLFLLICILGTPVRLLAQQIDPATVQVENLSDDQIRQIVKEINSRGLTVDQALQLAKARGASQHQVDQLNMRIQQMQLSGETEPAETTGQQIPGSLSGKTQMPGGLSGMQQNSIGLQGLGTGNLLDQASGAQRQRPNVSLKNKRIFGYELFNQDYLTFEPTVNIAVPSDYVLGIGDEVVIQVWGSSQQTYQLKVGPDGNITIPDLGPVNVANLNFSDAKQLITKRLTAIYNGMSGSDPNTFANVSISSLRSIKVNVIGDAIMPGTYTLPATASAFNALYMSGGPNENGSFRNIRVIRDNKLIAEVDVYDYLIRANTKSNVSLRDQDVIFIPPYHKRVETRGAFKRRAIFELKDGENVEELLNFSGGFSEDAAKSRLLVTRFTDDQYQLVDVNQDRFSQFALKNGDVVRVEEVIDRYENRVNIDGAVFRPGTYALDEGMKLSQLIGKAGGLREDHYAKRGLIIRLDGQLYPTTIAFDVEELMSGKNDPILKREDQVMIRDIFSIGEKKTVRILGEVMKPDEYQFYRNMTMKDLIFLAGGMTESASESFIEVARRNSREESHDINSKMATLFQFKIDHDLTLAEDDAAFLLQPFDQVYIRKAPAYEVQKTISIRGEVKFPGEYSISNKNERISDLINRAGGLTPYAYAQGARLKRFVDEQTKSQIDVVERLRLSLDSTIHIDSVDIKYEDLALQLPKIMENPGSSYDYLLRDRDQLFIPMKMEEVRVSGEVMNPIGLAWEKGRNLKHYIDNSGGFAPDAKKNKVYVVYSNGTTDVTKSFIFKKYPDVEPGSRIVVPTKPERPAIDNTAKWLAITSALSSLAVAIAAVLR